MKEKFKNLKLKLAQAFRRAPGGRRPGNRPPARTSPCRRGGRGGVDAEGLAPCPPPSLPRSPAPLDTDTGTHSTPPPPGTRPCRRSTWPARRHRGRSRRPTTPRARPPPLFFTPLLPLRTAGRTAATRNRSVRDTQCTPCAARAPSLPSPPPSTRSSPPRVNRVPLHANTIAAPHRLLWRALAPSESPERRVHRAPDRRYKYPAEPRHCSTPRHHLSPLTPPPLVHRLEGGAFTAKPRPPRPSVELAVPR